LGYIKNNKIYSHPKGRTAIFLGDIINVGHDNLEVLSIIKSMCDFGSAKCIIGNHEFFLLTLYFENPDFFQKKEIPPTYEIYLPFFREIRNEETFKIIIHWLASLPLAIKTETYAAVHAFWDEEQYKKLWAVSGGTMQSGMIAKLYREDKEIRNAAIEFVYGRRTVVPGIKSPDGSHLKFRYAWWNLRPGDSFKKIIVSSRNYALPDYPIPISYLRLLQPTIYKYPVFFGHYWLKKIPHLTHNKFCCLDFGGSKGGKLTAYRFDENTILDDEYLIYV
jgi:hypothetical protein